MEIQRTQRYCLVYTKKKKELGYEAKHGIKNISIEDYKGIIIVHESK